MKYLIPIVWAAITILYIITKPVIPLWVSCMHTGILAITTFIYIYTK